MASGAASDNIEMLKALYDFTAVYPKTISFDEGEYFILYQTSARQRNWWQVVSMKGNIGFVPSNYVMKIKVEQDFLISFLNSSIESLEKSSELEINGIMSKNELLDRLREKKQTMERLYLDNTERDCDSSLSCSQSYGSERDKSQRQSQLSQQQQQQLLNYSPPATKRLDMSKKSMSSPAVGANVPPPQIIPESPSMGSMSTPTASVPVAAATTTTTGTAATAATGTTTAAATAVTGQSQAAAAAAAAAAVAAQKVSEPTQDNSITSEPSETTTTTTTTSEDVVTTYKEPSQHDSSGAAYAYAQQNGSAANGSAGAGSGSGASGDGGGAAAAAGGGGGGDDDNDDDDNGGQECQDDSKAANCDGNNSGNSAGASCMGDGGDGGDGGVGGTITDISEQITDEKCTVDDKSDADASETPSATSIDGCNGNGAFVEHSGGEHSQALDSPLDNSSLNHRGMAAIGGYHPHAHASLKVESSDVYQIVDAIRRNTNLSFDMSCEALRVVLTSLEQLYNGAINPYLEAVAVHVTDKVKTPKELLGIAHDSKRLQYIFQQMAACKNDSEQRSWMLYEDEDDIVQFLEELVDILNNADENISCYEMSCDQYQMFINLVQYYQMEARWNIKRLLLKAFTAACHLDNIIVDILLTSVLPLEIVEDMKTHFSNLERFKELVKMLTIIFSLGQSMPVNHQDYLGVHFASFLLEIVEGDNPEVLVDMVIALVLAFNQQFTDCKFNVITEAMQNLQTAKIFTEKLLLLLNREDDPTRLLKHANKNMNSVLKMFIDIFSQADTAGMFYTNDSKVLIDILVRQLSDLEAGSPTRPCYLELCRRILRNTNYQEHQHRKQDLMKIFTRIFCEETECSASDQQLVREIANEFPQLFKA